MTRAEEKAVEYQMKTHGPNVIGGASILSEDEYMRFNMNYDFKAGYEEAEKDLGWHSVEESLPPMDEEVIVLRDEINDCLLPDASFVGVAHIVDTDLAVDYNGWNVPGVRYWMPMPKIIEEEL